MLKDHFISQMKLSLGFTPTSDQEQLMCQLADFVLSQQPRSVFLLSGHAGTGKTSVMSALVKTLVSFRQPCVLMAPTGRAAKVMAVEAEHPAHTIHRQIYRQESALMSADFALGFNKRRDALFIVDEASMISNGEQGHSIYGSGRLLEDLVEFVYASPGCRLILMGDDAQLPPVGEAVSPVFADGMLETCGLQVWKASLKDVVRQKKRSGILWNATRLRQFIAAREVQSFPRICFSRFPDVTNVPGNELIEELSSSYSRVGLDDTIVVTRSNKRANVYNQGIRFQILGREEELSSGDYVMVAKNNYYWLESEMGKNIALPMDFIANGDIAVVERVRDMRELYGFRFATCWLRFPDYDDYELEATVLLDTLHAESPALPQTDMERMLQAVMEEENADGTKKNQMKLVRDNPYLNALQIKFAYAVTCHKAQGGQWAHVYVDQGYITGDMLGMDYYRWLYTAMTRATDKLFLVNWKEELSE